MNEIETVIFQAIARNTPSKQPAAVVAAMIEQGWGPLPQATREVAGESGDSFDQLEERAERSLREWRERIIGTGIQGGDTPFVEIVGPALVPDGHAVIDRARWKRVIAALNDCAAASSIEMVDDALETLMPCDLEHEP